MKKAFNHFTGEFDLVCSNEMPSFTDIVTDSVQCHIVTMSDFKASVLSTSKPVYLENALLEGKNCSIFAFEVSDSRKYIMPANPAATILKDYMYSTAEGFKPIPNKIFTCLSNGQHYIFNGLAHELGIGADVEKHTAMSQSGVTNLYNAHEDKFDSILNARKARILPIDGTIEQEITITQGKCPLPISIAIVYKSDRWKSVALGDDGLYYEEWDSFINHGDYYPPSSAYDNVFASLYEGNFNTMFIDTQYGRSLLLGEPLIYSYRLKYTIRETIYANNGNHVFIDTNTYNYGIAVGFNIKCTTPLYFGTLRPYVKQYVFVKYYETENPTQVSFMIPSGTYDVVLGQLSDSEKTTNVICKYSIEHIYDKRTDTKTLIIEKEGEYTHNGLTTE